MLSSCLPKWIFDPVHINNLLIESEGCTGKYQADVFLLYWLKPSLIFSHALQMVEINAFFHYMALYVCKIRKTWWSKGKYTFRNIWKFQLNLLVGKLKLLYSNFYGMLTELWIVFQENDDVCSDLIEDKKYIKKTK